VALVEMVLRQALAVHQSLMRVGVVVLLKIVQLLRQMAAQAAAARVAFRTA
jgi:hypothetical protein